MTAFFLGGGWWRPFRRLGPGFGLAVLLVATIVLLEACLPAAAALEKSVSTATTLTPKPRPTAMPSLSIFTQSHTYYVDPNGSDTTGDGSAANPWRTIQHSATQVAPGDTVLINPGTYEGGITVDISGTASNPITFRANGTDVVIDGSGSERDAFFITEANYISVEGLTIRTATRAGLRISWSDHVSVRNSTFAENTTWGLFTDFSNYLLIENNDAYGSIEEHGIYVSNSSDYPTIRGNRIHHNHACGIHMNGDASMGGDGIVSYGLVEQNVIYENGTGGCSAINMDGVTDTIVRNNLLYSNHASGISVYQIDGGSGSQGNRLLNNTIVMPADSRWAINIPDSSDADNQVFNNIIFTYHTWKGSILIAEPDLSGFESDYNVVVDRFSADGGNNVIGLANWQTLGYDVHSLITTPDALFVDPAGHDYHLKAGSPAIDAGISLPDVSTDLEGNIRPSGSAFDIGAFEYTPSRTPDWLYTAGFLWRNKGAARNQAPFRLVNVNLRTVALVKKGSINPRPYLWRWVKVSGPYEMSTRSPSPLPIITAQSIVLATSDQPGSNE